MPCKFVPFGAFHYEVNSILGVEDFIQLDNIPVSGLLQNFDFAVDPSYIRLLFYSALFQYLDRNLWKVLGDTVREIWLLVR